MFNIDEKQGNADWPKRTDDTFEAIFSEDIRMATREEENKEENKEDE